jgi:PucR family transcriptional regulator, purine catabolism regulatory protein
VLTITDLLQTELPDGTAVLAGADYLGREVSWATALRARAPGLGSLRGREIVLLSLGVLRALDTSLTLARAVEQLQPLVSAIAVLGEVDAAAAECAESMGQPLLQLPKGTDLEQLERSIQRAVLDSRQASNQRARELEREFSSLALSGHGFDVLVQTLARRTGKPVVLQAPDIEPIVRATRYGLADAESVQRALASTDQHVTSWLREISSKPDDSDLGRFSTPDEELDRYVAPVRDGRGPVGALSIIAPPRTVNESDRNALAAAAHACAIELARRDAHRSALDSAEGDIVENVIASTADDDVALLSRAKRLGVDFGRPYVAVTAVSDLKTPIEALAAGIESAWRESGVEALVRIRDSHVLSLIPVDGSDALDKYARELLEQVASRVALQTDDETVHYGLGMCGAGVDALRASISQAEQALKLGCQTSSETIHAYADLGLFRLLLAAAREPSLHPELEAFHESTLGKLLAYDRERGSELVPTLEAFLGTLGAPLATAERLHVHRNTLLYRLTRIEAVAGLDLRDPEARLMLHLALRIGQANQIAALHSE